jgi:hypothetical protein
VPNYQPLEPEADPNLKIHVLTTMFNKRKWKCHSSLITPSKANIIRCDIFLAAHIYPNLIHRFLTACTAGIRMVYANTTSILHRSCTGSSYNIDTPFVELISGGEANARGFSRPDLKRQAFPSIVLPDYPHDIEEASV